MVGVEKRARQTVRRSVVRPVNDQRLADVPGFFTATAKSFPPTNFAEFLAYARANPGKLRYGSVGVGSFPQFDMEILSRRAGLSLVHIPNKSGAAGMLNDLVAGDTQVGFLNMATSAPMMRAGQLRPLAIVTEQRSPEHPDVATMAEAGFPGVGTLQLLGLFAPASVPANAARSFSESDQEGPR